MPNITNRECEKKVSKQTKIYDEKCPGFYVSVNPTGATFNLKYFDRAQQKQVSVRVGLYDRENFDVEDARTEALALRARSARGEDIAKSTRAEQADQAKRSGVKVGDIITAYTEHMKEPVKKDDGERRARIESWEGSAGYLERFARPVLGHRVASEVTNVDIAKLVADIAKGKAVKGRTPSLSSARNCRNSMSAMFKWAAQAQNRETFGLTMSPCHDLPPLDEEPSRERYLDAKEIKTLWWGLDDPNLPASRDIALALKFELTTMMRSKEYIKARRDEIVDLGKKDARIIVPLKRVKKRRLLIQPLSKLAQDVIKEAMTNEFGGDYIFAGKFPGAPMSEKALSQAVNGKRVNGKTVRVGIREFLGMKHWTPHDLRRTAATLAGDLKFSESRIGQCLDHRADRDEDGEKIASVTGVYNRSERHGAKQEVLEAVGAKLTQIIGNPPRR